MRLPNLTPLRFFLATTVLLFHAAEFSFNRGFPSFNGWPIFTKGSEAVYGFFVLSGFLIIRQLYDEKWRTGKINIKAFFIKRIFRILPLYYLILLVGFFYYRFLLPSLNIPFDNHYDLVKGIILSVTLFANVFATYSPGGILEILWSIAIEEQFYLFIAPILFLIPARKIMLSLFIMTAILIGLYFFGFEFFRKYHMLFFFFSLGGIFGIFIEKKAVRNFLWKWRWMSFTLVILYFFSNYFQLFLSSAFSYLVTSALLFSVFIATLSVHPIRFLEVPVLNYLGEISYGIYMFHPIAMQIIGFVFLKTQLPNFGIFSFVLFTILVLLLTIFLAAMSKKYFENYFLGLRKVYLSKSS